MECQFPSIQSTSEEITSILKSAKTIAIVGLSPNPDKDSYMVAEYLINHGYTVYPIYPKENTILGQKVYRSMSEIPGHIDIVDVFRKPDAIDAIVDEILERGDIGTLWLQLGIVNNSACERAKSARINVIQNKCTKIEHRGIGRV